MPAQKPEDLHPLFEQAIRAGDLDTLMSLYESGASMPNQTGEVRTGAELIRQDLEPFAAMKPDMKLKLNKLIQAGDIALMHSEWAATSPAAMSGRSIEVARRQADGTWRYVIDDPFTLGS